jgi:hypothetical protein
MVILLVSGKMVRDHREMYKLLDNIVEGEREESKLEVPLHNFITQGVSLRRDLNYCLSVSTKKALFSCSSYETSRYRRIHKKEIPLLAGGSQPLRKYVGRSSFNDETQGINPGNP